eukprot:6213477-Pleurochrysis_carterae.AAC.4
MHGEQVRARGKGCPEQAVLPGHRAPEALAPRRLNGARHAVLVKYDGRIDHVDRRSGHVAPLPCRA